MALALRFSGVVKTYGKCRALDGLDLEVPSGVAMGLVGSNGAGKTTSFAVASGLARLNRGSVELFGEGPFDSGRHAGRVSVMPQDTNFPPYARVRELLVYFAGLQGMPRKQIPQAVASVLDWVHLADRAEAPIRTLSHGMRRRVVIAQAFLGQPDLVMLDEPMSGLDPREVVNIRNLLKQRPGHQTLIISSHNLHEVERICDHVAFIAKGRLVRQSTMDAVTRRHQAVSYQLAPESSIDLQVLGDRLPDAVLQMTAPGEMTCSFVAGNQSLESVNAVVLRYLLDNRIPLYEVRRGDALEAVYMGDALL